MKQDKLKVGVKGTRPAEVVPVNLAENLEDMQKLSHGNLGVVIRCFNRGFRIESQERSGARDAFREGKDNAAIAALVAGYDPTVVHPRTVGPRKPVEVKLAKGKKSYTPEELANILANAGIKANVTLDDGTPIGPQTPAPAAAAPAKA